MSHHLTWSQAALILCCFFIGSLGIYLLWLEKKTPGPKRWKRGLPPPDRAVKRGTHQAAPDIEERTKGDEGKWRRGDKS